MAPFTHGFVKRDVGGVVLHTVSESTKKKRSHLKKKYIHEELRNETSPHRIPHEINNLGLMRPTAP